MADSPNYVQEKKLEQKHLIDKSLNSGSEDDASGNKANYWDKLKGICCVMTWITALTISNSCCQLLRRKIPDFELNTLRLLTGQLFVIIGLIYEKRLPRIPKYQIPAVVGFGVVRGITSIATYTAVTFISIASMQCIVITSTIVSGLFLFRLFWYEQVSAKRVFFAVSCIVGVILVIQPDFLFVKEHMTGSESNMTHHVTGSESNMTHHVTGSESHVIGNEPELVRDLDISLFSALGYSLSVVSGCVVSVSVLLVKRYPFLGENFLVTNFWSIVVSVASSPVLMLIFETPTLPNNWVDFLLLLGHCCTYVIILVSMLLSSMYISGNTVTILFSTSAVLCLIPQYTVLSSVYPGNRNWTEVVGAVIVVLGSSLGSALELWNAT